MKAKKHLETAPCPQHVESWTKFHTSTSNTNHQLNNNWRQWPGWLREAHWITFQNKLGPILFRPGWAWLGPWPWPWLWPGPPLWPVPAPGCMALALFLDLASAPGKESRYSTASRSSCTRASVGACALSCARFSGPQKPARKTNNLEKTNYLEIFSK